MWKRDSALRVSLTNLELLKSLLRRRRVNFGKKRPFLKKKSKKKIQSPPTQKKSFTISILKKKKSPITTTYWLLVILPNSTLSVFNKKQQQKNQQNIQKNNRKTPFTWYTVCFFGHYTTIPYLQSPISQVFSTTILYYSPEKKVNVLTKNVTKNKPNNYK